MPQVSHLRPGSQSPQSSSNSPQPGAPSFEPHPKGGVSFPAGNDRTPLRQPQTSNSPSRVPHPSSLIRRVGYRFRKETTALLSVSLKPPTHPKHRVPHPSSLIRRVGYRFRKETTALLSVSLKPPTPPSRVPHPSSLIPKGGISFPEGNDPTPALVSGFPRQLTGSPLEWLLIPLIHFVLLGFLPLARMRKTTDPAFAAGCGQFFLCDREAYFKTGGHSGIKLTMHDGLRLPRLFREHGYRTDLADLTPLASVRMYTNTRDTWQGLAKNATEGIAAPGRIVPISII